MLLEDILLVVGVTTVAVGCVVLGWLVRGRQTEKPTKPKLEPKLEPKLKPEPQLESSEFDEVKAKDGQKWLRIGKKLEAFFK